ncbi:MAG: hypothetical protein NC348_12860 [Clostridium sp.]|nr:hypothetical protein [Clostridium sp.]
MSLVDIARQLNRPAGTIRRWKSIYSWDGERSSRMRAKEKAVISNGTKETGHIS